MIYEHAYLSIDPDHAQEFAEVVPIAREQLLAAPGCHEVAVFGSVDQPGTYLLRVGWDRIEDHLEVFPTTPQSVALATTIGGFFVHAPTVVHFGSAEV